MANPLEPWRETFKKRRYRGEPKKFNKSINPRGGSIFGENENTRALAEMVKRAKLDNNK
jgi:hypothetical protein